MDAKLMLVLTFTTIVVVAARPPWADIAARPPWILDTPYADIAARPPWADTKAEVQIKSRGDCNHVTLKDGRRFCVNLCVTSKEYEYMKVNRFS